MRGGIICFEIAESSGGTDGYSWARRRLFRFVFYFIRCSLCLNICHSVTPQSQVSVSIFISTELHLQLLFLYLESRSTDFKRKNTQMYRSLTYEQDHDKAQLAMTLWVSSPAAMLRCLQSKPVTH